MALLRDQLTGLECERNGPKTALLYQVTDKMKIDMNVFHTQVINITIGDSVG